MPGVAALEKAKNPKNTGFKLHHKKKKKTEKYAWGKTDNTIEREENINKYIISIFRDIRQKLILYVYKIIWQIIKNLKLLELKIKYKLKIQYIFDGKVEEMEYSTNKFIIY